MKFKAGQRVNAKAAAAALQKSSMPLTVEDVLRQEYEAQFGASDQSRPIYEILNERRRAALCLSGGGIRSATFGLGVLQGLAQANLLDKFHYLSTVSGGGYIGGWLSAWIRNCGIGFVTRQLADGERLRNSAPFRYLRDYSNYLTPRVGLASGDTWAGIGAFLRNLLLTWAVFFPLILSLLTLPPLIDSAAGRLEGLGPLSILIDGLFAAFLSYLSLTYVTYYRPSLYSGNLKTVWSLYSCLGPLLLSSIGLSFFSVSFPQDLYLRSVRLNGRLVLLIIFGISAFLLAEFTAFLLNRKTPKKISLAGKPKSALIDEFFWLICVGAIWGTLQWAAVSAAALNRLYFFFNIPLTLITFLIAATVFVGLVSQWTSDDDREWWARFGGYILLLAIGLAFLGFVAIVGPSLISRLNRSGSGISASFVYSVLTSSGAASLWAAFSSKTGNTPSAAKPSSWRPSLTTLFTVVGAVFIAFLLSVVAFFLLRLIDSVACVSRSGICNSGALLLIIILFTGLVFSLWFSTRLTVNRFSLHAIYRNRLIRAYLGASNYHRAPVPFINFDENDNFPLSAAAQKPLHIINCALNLTHGDNLAWQERKAESFTASPLHCGAAGLGYRKSDQYARFRESGITLGTAIAISGAAASPNMGYNSSPVLTLLMAFFNIRLGWWLGNPGRPGSQDEAYQKGEPQGLVYWLKEALGLTTAKDRYVYLSDGGHFENLGLYEMVRRRCRYIVVSDASADPNYIFSDLGNAIQKIRVDLGIGITFDSFQIRKLPATDSPTLQPTPAVCALGKINYGAVHPGAEPGALIYIKPVLCPADSPIDLCHYGRAHPEFPNQSTINQWFSETEFESYRMLGYDTIRQLVTADGKATWSCTDFADFEKKVKAYLSELSSNSVSI